MLILTRRPAEAIYIGEQVTVTVLGVVGNQVRFGIEAPRSIAIDRAEIYERKKRSGQSNAQSINQSTSPSGVGANGIDPSVNGNVVAHGDTKHADVNGNLADSPDTHASAATVPER